MDNWCTGFPHLAAAGKRPCITKANLWPRRMRSITQPTHVTWSAFARQ